MSQPVPSPAGGDVTTDAFLARVPEASLLRLRVVEVAETGTATHQIRLTGDGSAGSDDLAGFVRLPGQDLMILVDTSGGRIIRRRYTIRRFDPAERLIDLHVVTENEGPGAAWARALRVGDAVEAIGPRGKISIASGAAWHLFFGDDVAVPAISAMVEALDAGTRAVVVAEVAAVADETKPDPAHPIDLSWTWLHRGRRSAGTPDELLAAATSVDLPPGDGHAYVFGEAAVVAAVKGALQSRGVPAERISAKAYWGRGRANASHGEPLR